MVWAGQHLKLSYENLNCVIATYGMQKENSATRIFSSWSNILEEIKGTFLSKMRKHEICIDIMANI